MSNDCPQIHQQFQELLKMKEEFEILFAGGKLEETYEMKKKMIVALEYFEPFLEQSIWEKKCLDYMRRLLQEGADEGSVVEDLAGLDSDQAWQMREELLKEATENNDKYPLSNIARSLAGIDSDRAWQMREKLLERGVDEGWFAMSLSGLDSERAWNMREELLSQQKVAESYMTKSLVGIDSDRAWKMRERVLEKGEGRSYIVWGLAGLDSDRAWEIRKMVLENGEYNSRLVEWDAIGGGLVGLDSDQAWEMRERLLERIGGRTGESFLINGLAGIDSDRAWKIREKLLLRDDIDRKNIARSLAGLDSDQAWDMREELIKDGGGLYRADISSVAQSLNGNYITAIALRKIREDKKKKKV